MSKRKQDRFLLLYKGVHDRFERFCRARACGDMPYEDLMNESLLIAYQKMDTIQKEGSFLSFLIGISRRILANSQRKKKAKPAVDESILNNYADPEDVMSRRMDVALLHKALAFLPAEQREALILFEITGFSIKEIAHLITACPNDALVVLSATHNSTNELEEIYKSSNYEKLLSDFFNKHQA